MFDLPDAKRVHRSDLYSPPSPLSPPLGAELEELLREKLKQLYGNPLVTTPELDGSGDRVHAVSNASSGPDREATRGEEEAVRIEGQSGVGTGSDTEHGGNATVAFEAVAGFEFRLFSSSKSIAVPKPKSDTSPLPPPRIVLDSDTDSTAAEGSGARDRRGGFVVAQRRAGYYFAAPATPAAKRAFCEASVTGEAVRALQSVRYRGWEVPWRVVKGVAGPAPGSASAGGKNPKEVPVMDGRLSAAGGAGARGEEVEMERKKRTKPGKKRRIVLRIRARAADEAVERRSREEREKRTRQNRRKKVRRKEKEKARKGAGAAAGDGGNAGGEI